MKKIFISTLVLFIGFSLSAQDMVKRIPIENFPHTKSIARKAIQNTYSVRSLAKTLLGDTIVVGTTTYDWQGNNLSLRHIYYDSGVLTGTGYELTGVVWIHSDQPSPWPDRHMYYWSVVTGTAGPVQNTYRDGYGTIDYKTDGMAIVSEHYDNGTYYCSAVGYETFAPGYASFAMSECPLPPDSDAIWPRVGVDVRDNVLILSKTYEGGNSRIFYTSTVWGNWATSDWSPWILLDTLANGFHNLAASKISSKFTATYNCIVDRGETNPALLAREGRLYYRESTTGGATWNPAVDLTALVPHSDLVCANRSHYPFYDNADNLHILFITTPLDTVIDPGDWGMWFDAGQLWHWSATTGLNLIDRAPGIVYFATPPNVCIYHDLYSLPSISENTDDNNLYALWQYTPWDEKGPITEAPVGDLMLSRSRDGGIHWTRPVDITNTPDKSEVFPNLSPFFQGDTIRLAYLQDLRAGAYVFVDQGCNDTVPADNPYVYMKVAIPPDGDAELVSIDAPTTGDLFTTLRDTITPAVTVRNNGTDSIDIQVYCSIRIDYPFYGGVDSVLSTGGDTIPHELYYRHQIVGLPGGASRSITFDGWVADKVADSLFMEKLLADTTTDTIPFYIYAYVAYLGDTLLTNDEKRLDFNMVSGIEETSHPVARNSISLSVAPNLTSRDVSISFNLPKRENITLKVYDISGRVISVLTNGVVETGRHTIKWDGRFNSGKKCPSGIYFIRLATTKDIYTRKITFIR